MPTYIGLFACSRSRALRDGRISKFHSCFSRLPFGGESKPSAKSLPRRGSLRPNSKRTWEGGGCDRRGSTGKISRESPEAGKCGGRLSASGTVSAEPRVEEIKGLRGRQASSGRGLCAFDGSPKGDDYWGVQGSVAVDGDGNLDSSNDSMVDFGSTVDATSLADITECLDCIDDVSWVEVGLSRARKLPKTCSKAEFVKHPRKRKRGPGPSIPVGCATSAISDWRSEAARAPRVVSFRENFSIGLVKLFMSTDIAPAIAGASTEYSANENTMLLCCCEAQVS